MAKNRNGATIRAIKKRDNRTSTLPMFCGEPGCPSEAYVLIPKNDGTGTFTRKCAGHAFQPKPQGGPRLEAFPTVTTSQLLERLGLR